MLLAAVGFCDEPDEVGPRRHEVATGGTAVPLDGKAATGGRPGVDDSHLAAGEVEDREFYLNRIHYIQKVVFDPHDIVAAVAVGGEDRWVWSEAADERLV